LKRFFRIIPAYLAVLVLYYTVPAFTERSHLPPLWKFLTFTQNFGLDLSKQAAFSHAWSLCIEEQFYLILPLVLIAVGGKKGIWLIPALFILGFAVRIFSWYTFIEPVRSGFGVAFYKWMYYPTYNRLDGLLAGLSLAALFTFAPALKDKVTQHGNGLLFVSLALATGAYFVCYDPYTFQTAVFGYPLVSVAFGVMVLAALSPSCVLYKYSSRVTRFIAAISYSLYLTHKQLVHLTHVMLKDFGLTSDSYLLFWISAAVSLIGATILYFVVEQPFLKLRDRLVLKNSKTMGYDRKKDTRAERNL
jgi:peptidoglycan/LPS O-acetylase OafA/YrhL